ncbi:MarR family transcriptional regulator [Proteiniclasticum sp. SCR006]|uniref:MarR family transcriptional regulator n=1 Tax=Proteiniclasticum aestuarii TaxID=2817862 RepID=A0A939HCY8_9CLOT|nr:MarR family transcriptional regulator [Proteiniclasticum aestuarii]MBO1266050.1 MarR family transcriptional regulator [Proteiniclasticum aestuarii]
MDRSTNISFLIKLIGDTIETKANKRLKSYGITLSQGRILAYLYERRTEKTSQKDMEEYFQVTHPTIIGILKRLESKGLISSEIDEIDKRVRNISLSPDFEIKSSAVLSYQKEMEDQILEKMSDADTRELKEYLNKLLVNVEQME